MVPSKISVFHAFWIAATMFFIGSVLQIGADENDWVQTNGPYGGRISALYATPEGVLFAGTEGAGIFRSADLGDSWIPVNTGLSDEPGHGLSAAAFAQKRNMLYAGTTGGLSASTDGGDTWHHVPTLPKPVSVSGIVTIGARVYIGTLGDGVWYSDDGDSWMPVNDGLGSRLIHELSKIGTTVIAGTADGAFRKEYSENAWTPINAGFVPKPIDMAPINKARIESGVDTPLPPHSPAVIRVGAFAVMEDLLYMGVDMGGDDGLFRSDDEGDSWTRITSKEMVHTVEALTAFGTTLYASTFGGGIFRSEDSGDTWTTVNDGLKDWGVTVLLTVSEDTVFVGTLNGGVFRTTDGGNAWVEVNIGLTNTSVTELEVLGETIYAGIGHWLVYSVDGGESWPPVQISAMPIEYHFSALSVSDGQLYVGATVFAPHDQGGVVGGVFRLDTERNSLVALNTHRALYGIESMEIVGSTFYVGTQGRGVFRWTQGLDAWTNLGLEGHTITALSVNGKKVYAGTLHGEIFRLKGAGKSWELISSDNMLDSFISDFRWIGSTLYAATWGKGIFRSANDGNSWTQINGVLDEPSVTTIEQVGTETYIGTYYNGVFQWIADENGWKSIGSLRRRVDSLAVLDGFLYAGTIGGGVFKIPIEK